MLVKYKNLIYTAQRSKIILSAYITNLENIIVTKTVYKVIIIDD